MRSMLLLLLLLLLLLAMFDPNDKSVSVEKGTVLGTIPQFRCGIGQSFSRDEVCSR